MPVSVIISAAVEGDVDEAIVRKLVAHAGGQIGSVYGKNGKPMLRKKIKGYNNAARHTPWLVLIDLDNDADCAPPVREEWVPDPAPHLCFRIAVREVEVRLMADATTLARFLSVTANKIPAEPEKLAPPKDAMVNLARQSRRTVIRGDMVPRKKSGRRVGPAYPSRLVEYVRNHWQPDVAAQHSESLKRSIDCLLRLVRITGKEIE